MKYLNYLIPPQLKKIGYEIIRPEEAHEIDIRFREISDQDFRLLH
jgi:hypothetical protein